MDDAALVAAFESTELEQFSHVEHVRVAWWYLRILPLAEALARCSTGIRRFAAAKGATDKYHETITVFWMRTVAKYNISRNGTSLLEKANEVAYKWDKDFPLNFYSRDLLFSDEARARFVEPDLAPLNQ